MSIDHGVRETLFARGAASGHGGRAKAFRLGPDEQKACLLSLPRDHAGDARRRHAHARSGRAPWSRFETTTPGKGGHSGCSFRFLSSRWGSAVFFVIITGYPQFVAGRSSIVRMETGKWDTVGLRRSVSACGFHFTHLANAFFLLSSSPPPLRVDAHQTRDDGRTQAAAPRRNIGISPSTVRADDVDVQHHPSPRPSHRMIDPCDCPSPDAVRR